ncbi:hypothetical protein FNQ90_16770 [Streptomyces alkaliphilus]|uniref:Uncharacterized protein n=1 Tax=Streptomyces alkaliphilus TaxID=1472722 RepID=A0A7W3Y2U1_9ACTN|nr:hypothetical protein [Streptomyces alkaliphilus]MBB0245710.1 hypothetical protein [Streptomyces alkaliphilus]
MPGFTVDITGTTGMRTGEWADGEQFLILPDDRGTADEPPARVRLVAPDTAVSPGGSPRRAAQIGLRDDAAGADAGAHGGGVSVADVEERTARRAGMPHPILLLDGPTGERLCTVLPEEPGTPEPLRFRVEDGDGLELCRIVRRPSRIGRRAYWRILFPDGRPALTGHRGTWIGWIGFALTFPLWLLFFAGSLLVAAVTMGGVSEMLVWGAPKRTTWRTRWAPPLVGNALDFRYLRCGYRWSPKLVDPRIAWAQASLHHFRKMHKD